MKNKKKYLKKIDLATLLLHLIATLILALLSAGALRQNNLKMLELRDKVFQADKSGVGIEDSLKSLRTFLSSHMNTELPKNSSGKAIQLKYSYERAVNQEQLRIKEETARISELAKQSCASSTRELARVDCEQKYIVKNPISSPKNILPEMFSIEFISPSWSFDLAGWLIITTIGSLLLFVARILSIILARRYLKNNYH